MPETNGRTKLIFWLAGCLWFCLTTAIIFTGNVVNANDKTNTKEHNEIKKDMQICLDNLRKEIKQDIKDTQFELKAEIKDSQNIILQAIKNK